MSRSLHSSIEYFGGSNRWSRNVSDIVPEKSSIGLISSKISSRPDFVGTSSRPRLAAASTRACQASLPSSQSKLSVCRARRFGNLEGLPDLGEGDAARAELVVRDCVAERWCARRPRGVLPRARWLHRAHAGPPATKCHGSGQMAAQSGSIPDRARRCRAAASSPRPRSSGRVPRRVALARARTRQGRVSSVDRRHRL